MLIIIIKCGSAEEKGTSDAKDLSTPSALPAAENDLKNTSDIEVSSIDIIVLFLFLLGFGFWARWVAARLF